MKLAFQIFVCLLALWKFIELVGWSIGFLVVCALKDSVGIQTGYGGFNRR
jgi:hypothetical protein